MTKTKENDYKAISLAQTLERTLEQYNKHSQQKINFGIGVHNGELIVESKDGKFKFTSLGTAITLPKRISSHANSEVLLSEVVHRKTSAKVKAEKDHDFWQKWYTVHTEENIGIDKKGLFYTQNEPVLVIVNGGGILTPERIKQAYKEGLKENNNDKSGTN